MAIPVTTSTLVNTSGQRQYFDFLPPAGLYLADGEEYSYTGSIYDYIRRSGNGGIREKMVQALKYCLEQGLCEIKNDPELVLFDDVAGNSKKLIVDDGKLILRDPSLAGGEADIEIGPYVAP